MVLLMKRLLPRRTHEIAEAIGTQIVMIAVVAPFFFIFFYMFWNSLKPDYLFFEPGTWIFEPLWSNYTEVIEYSDLVPNIVNSLIISSSATFIGLVCGLLTAYTVARYNLRKLAMAILVTRMIPYITALVPFWIVYKHVGLLNTHAGIILSHLVITIPFGVWIMMGFIEDIPKDLEEAAWIDGASRTQAVPSHRAAPEHPGDGGDRDPLLHLLLEQLPARPGARGVRREHRTGLRLQSTRTPRRAGAVR